MKLGILLIIILSCSFGYSQNLNPDSINSYSLYHIYEEIIIQDRYSTQDCIKFGETLAKIDIEKGNRRVLASTGPFTTGCMTCMYYKHGFITSDFGSDDLRYETVDAFVDAYNKSMEKLLSIEAKREISNYCPDNNKIFSSYLTTFISLQIERLTDSTYNFSLSSDTLESLFKKDIDSLMVSVSHFSSDKESLEYYYKDIKNKGVEISDNGSDRSFLYITLDFKYMPPNFEICWCPILEQKYSVRTMIKWK